VNHAKAGIGGPDAIDWSNLGMMFVPECLLTKELEPRRPNGGDDEI
jgi:hypothetical protein